VTDDVLTLIGADFGLLREFCDPSRLVIWLAGIGPAVARVSARPAPDAGNVTIRESRGAAA
jgi:hypothetical protein